MLIEKANKEKLLKYSNKWEIEKLRNKNQKQK